MSKKVKLPRTRLSVEEGVYRADWDKTWDLYLYVDGFAPVLIHEYTKRSSAERGARRFAASVFNVFFDGPEYLPIYVDGDEIL